jgi:hypothetical protein
MTDDAGYDSLDDSDAEDDGVLDASDTLEGEPGDDPLDAGIGAGDRWSAGEGFGTTAQEERTGESFDQLLAEEEPDIDPYADEGARAEGGDEDLAGRLVAEDEGASPVEEADLVARDVGSDAGADSAEEDAVHVVDDN